MTKITAHTHPQGHFSSWWIQRPHLVLTADNGRKVRHNPIAHEFALFSKSRHCVGHLPERQLGWAIQFLETGYVYPKIELTDEQWDAFSRERKDDKDSALQACCSNISALRTAILAIKDNGGRLNRLLLANLTETWAWCEDGHDFDDEKHPSWKTLRSLIEQAGLFWQPVGWKEKLVEQSGVLLERTPEQILSSVGALSPPLATDPRRRSCPTCGKILYPEEICPHG